MRESLDLLSAALPGNVKIQTRIDPVPPILVDAREIQQILMNLCINAWQAIEPAAGHHHDQRERGSGGAERA